MAKGVRQYSETTNLITKDNSKSFDDDYEVVSLEAGDHTISNQGPSTSVWLAEQDIASVDITETEIAPGEARTFNIATARSVSVLKGLEAIYGARWDKGTSPTLTRTDDAAGLTAEAGVDAGVVTNDFDSEDIFGEIADETVGGNVFVRIPKLYITKVDGANYKSWQVSKNRMPGSYLPWCFWDFTNEIELDHVDIGKYKATSDGGGTPKLESKPDLYPLCNQNIVTFRTYAEANNTGGLLGYQQLDIHAIDVLQTLMTIEFATLNMQTIMYGFGNGYYGAAHVALVADTGVNAIVVTNAQGATYRSGQTISIHLAAQSATPYNLPNTYGRTITAITADTPAAGQTTIEFDGAAINVALNDFVMNTGWKNGFSSAIAASSGSLVSNSDGKYPCVYRGIESPYGDLWQFVDGVNINDRQAWVCADADDYASNVFAAPYEQLSYVNHNANNYVQTMGWDANYPFAAFPTAVHASSSQYYCDYHSQNTGARIARFGGFWTYGALCGPWFWGLNDSSAGASVFIGGRLMRKAVT